MTNEEVVEAFHRAAEQARRLKRADREFREAHPDQPATDEESTRRDAGDGIER